MRTDIERQRSVEDRHADPTPGVVSLIASVGRPDYLDRLVDYIGSLAAHDRVTVTRYSTQAPPEFLTYRNFDKALVQRYLEIYYPYDPFYEHWCAKQEAGVVPLRRFSSRALKQGLYIAEFLYQSAIRDEVGVLIDDEARATVAVFLERSHKNFARRDITRLQRAFPVIQAVHGVHRRLQAPTIDRRPSVREAPRRAPRLNGDLPADLWPDLTVREREIAALILAGHPSSAIAGRLGISTGTVRIHRHNIYGKLDITTEREIFLQYLEFAARGG
jgi:DNA-binding CsgD family transcriptional regulator